MKYFTLFILLLFAFTAPAESFIPYHFSTSLFYKQVQKESQTGFLTEEKNDALIVPYKGSGDSLRPAVRLLHRLPLAIRMVEDHSGDFIHRSGVDFFPSAGSGENYLPTFVVYAYNHDRPIFYNRHLTEKNASLFLTEIAKADQRDNDDIAMHVSQGLTFTLEKHQAKAIIYFGQKSKN